MFPSLIALRRTASASRALAWVALITFAIGAIFARDLILIQSVQVSNARALEAQIVAPSAEKRLTKLRPSGMSKRTAWNPTDLPEDDDETDEDSDTVAPSHARLTLPGAAFVVAAAALDARLARVLSRAFFVPIARRHATPVRGPPSA